MPLFEHHARPLYRFPANELSRIAALILMAVSISSPAGEPGVASTTTAASGGNSTAGLAQSACVTQSLYLLLDKPQSVTVSTNSEPATTAPTASVVEVQTNLVPTDSPPLVRDNSRPAKPLTVEAGYGRMWDEQSTLQKICADYQDPGYAYVSAHFSF